MPAKKQSPAIEENAGIPAQGNTETTEIVETTNAAIVPAQRRWTDADLRAIESFDDALAMMAEIYGDEGIDVADQVLGNGFTILRGNDKDRLVGVMTAFLQWKFREGNYSEEYVSVLAVTKSGEKYIFNVSGGICEQLMAYTESTGRAGGLIARKGLTRSDYENPAIAEGTWKEGEWRSASTYYIDQTA